MSVSCDLYDFQFLFFFSISVVFIFTDNWKFCWSYSNCQLKNCLYYLRLSWPYFISYRVSYFDGLSSILKLYVVSRENFYFCLCMKKSNFFFYLFEDFFLCLRSSLFWLFHTTLVWVFFMISLKSPTFFY